MRDNKVTRRQTFPMLAGLAAAATTLEARSDSNMFLSLNSVLVNNRVKWPEFPRLAAKTGFPGTDVMLAPAMKEGADATNALLKQLSLKPAIIDFPVDFRKDDAAFEASLAKLDEQARFAAAIHCPRMFTYIMSSTDTPAAELRATYKQRFTKSAQVLAKHNVRLGLEFLGPWEIRTKFKHEFIWKMPDMLAFAKECGENVGLTVDSWHWHWAGASTRDIINAGRERIVHVHFNDAPNVPPEKAHDNQRLLPGEGNINLVGFLKALHEIGYRDALSVEVFGRLNDKTPEEAAKMGLAASLAVFKKAGVTQGD